MMRIGFLLLLLIVLFCPNASAATDKYETLFQKKANLIVNTLANNPKIPSHGDMEKYAWPAVIARLKKDYNDPWAKEIVKQFTIREPGSFYTNRDAFGAPGITRLIYLNRSQTNLNSFEKNYLKFLFAPQPKKGHYNFWQSGGTENFINMLRTSGYLLAMRGIELNIPEASEKMKYMEKWLLQKAKKTYKMGVAEWDSSTYTTFNLMGWLNLYDFAKDEKIKKAAQAVLDYYASTIALKYTYGIYGGAEQRGGGAVESFHSHTDYLAWLWFSEEIPKDDKFLVWPAYIQTIHGATSSYRPPKEAIALARKKFNQEAYYQNAKANYSLSKLEFPEFFYIGKTYTLGSAIVEDGGQIVNWKLVSYPNPGKSTQSITGGNSYKGVGKTVFDRYLQSKNILIQMTYISPELRNNFNLQKLRSYFDVFLSKIPCGKSCQFILKRKLESFISLETYPVEDINSNFPVKSYVTYSKNNITKIKEGRYFIQTNQTYLAILPFSDFKLSQRVSSQKSRAYLENKAKLGQLTGFVIEVGNSFEQGSFENFQNLIIQKTKLNLSNINDGKIVYQDINGSLLEVNYQFQHIFPSGKINNQEINLKNLNGRLYDGNNLQVKNYRLRIQDSESVYEVDYRGDIPIFTRNKR